MVVLTPKSPAGSSTKNGFADRVHIFKRGELDGCCREEEMIKNLFQSTHQPALNNLKEAQLV